MGYDSFENRYRVTCKKCSKVVSTCCRLRKYCDSCSPRVKLTGRVTGVTREKPE
jgi:hypothetical protein